MIRVNEYGTDNCLSIYPRRTKVLETTSSRTISTPAKENAVYRREGHYKLLLTSTIDRRGFFEFLVRFDGYNL